jgi:hypothetical protein
MENAIISIGESIHASIPKTGNVMKELCAPGCEFYDDAGKDNGNHRHQLDEDVQAWS